MVKEGDAIAARRNPDVGKEACGFVERFSDRKLEPRAVADAPSDRDLRPARAQSADITSSRISRALHLTAGNATDCPPDRRRPGAPVRRHQRLAGGRDRKDHSWRFRQAHVRAVSSLHEQSRSAAIPCRAVHDGVSVGSESRRMHRASAEGHAVIDRLLGRRRRQRSSGRTNTRCPSES